MTISIKLPWPPKALSPNARVNAFAKAAAAKSYKRRCFAASCEAIGGRTFARHPHPLYPEGRVHVGIMFFPPARYRYDEDNMVASFKAGLDGLRDAMKVDDHWFHVMSDVGEHTVQDGLVEVVLEVEDEPRESCPE